MRVFASDGVKADLTEEQQKEFVDFFLESLDEEIEFVPESWLDEPGDDAKPVYTVEHKDGKRAIIVWPLKDEEGDYLYLTWDESPRRFWTQ